MEVLGSDIDRMLTSCVYRCQEPYEVPLVNLLMQRLGSLSVRLSRSGSYLDCPRTVGPRGIQSASDQHRGLVWLF